MKKNALSILFTGLLLPSLPLGLLTDAHADFRSMNVISTSPTQDFADLASTLGSDIRYSLTFGELADTATRDQYFALLNETLDRFDSEIVPILQANNIKVVLSLANPPGGFSTRAAPLPKMRIFDESWAQEAMIDVWELLAQRYVSSTVIVAYHLQNEPAIGSGPAAGLKNWYDLQQDLISAIRVYDTTHPISVAADYSSPTKLSKIKIPANAGEIWYSFKFYYPTKFLRQGVEIQSYKTCYPTKALTKRKTVNQLKKAINFGKVGNKTLFVTEFTTTRFAPSGCGTKFLQHVLNIFEKNNWNWAYHAWREADPWSLELPALEDAPSGLTERAKILKRYFDL